MPAKQLIPTSIKLTSDMKERVQKMAQVKDKSAHVIMVQAIEKYLQHEEQREKLRNDALKAHDDYMLTGLHATNDEVKIWLAELAQGNQAEKPKCHQ